MRATRIRPKSTARLFSCASGETVIVHRDAAFELRPGTVTLGEPPQEAHRDSFERAVIEHILLGGRAI